MRREEPGRSAPTAAVGGGRHHDAMLHWFEQLAAGLAATAIGAYTVVPRINARIAEVAGAHEDRRTFRCKLTSIVGLCQRLRLLIAPDDASPEYATRLNAERDRWLAQLDEHTAWLVDNTECFALGYPRARGIRDLAADYAFAARIIFISEREDSERFALIEQLTSHAHVIFAASRRSSGFRTAFVESLSTLRQEIDELSATPISLGPAADEILAESVPAEAQP